MTTFLTVLIIVACILLIMVILIQNPKGGGLVAEFSSSNQFMGVRRTADFLEKATWTLAIVLLVLSFLSSANKVTELVSEDSIIQEQIENTPEPLPEVPTIPQNIPTPGTP